ncbi:hypothetical protein DV515_00005401, partial [Chloebia gouldiae]
RRILFKLLPVDVDYSKDGQGVTHLPVTAQDMESSEKKPCLLFVLTPVCYCDVCGTDDSYAQAEKRMAYPGK